MQLKSRLAGPDCSLQLRWLLAQHVFIFVKCALKILRLEEQIPKLQLKSGIIRQRGRHGDKLGLRIGRRLALQQVADKFEPRPQSIVRRVLRPHPVSSIVIVLNGARDIILTRKQPAQCQIDGPILRVFLPQPNQV